MTLVGPGNTDVDPKHEYANLWRRGSKMILANSIFINMRYGIDIRDKETGDALTDKTSLIKNNIYQSFTADKAIVADGNVPSFATVDLLKTYLTTNNNTFLDDAAAKNLLVNPYSLTSPNFILKSGSVAATGASF